MRRSPAGGSRIKFPTGLNVAFELSKTMLMCRKWMYGSGAGSASAPHRGRVPYVRWRRGPVLDEDVCVLDESAQDPTSVVRLKVRHYGFLAAVQRDEVTRRTMDFVVVAPGEVAGVAFDLDHAGAQVCELPRRKTGRQPPARARRPSVLPMAGTPCLLLSFGEGSDVAGGGSFGGPSAESARPVGTLGGSISDRPEHHAVRLLAR